MLYGAICLFSEMIAFSLLIVISLILNTFIYTLFWNIFFLPIRTHLGGYHAPNSVLCLAISTTFGVLFSLFAKYIKIDLYFMVSTLILSIIIVIKYAPITHKNRPLSDKFKLEIHKRAIFFILIESFLTIFIYIKLHIYSCASLMGIFSAILFALIELTLRKFKIHSY